jgi:hypothetical protein
MTLAKHLCYGRYLIRHKAFVLLEACRLGVPIRGLLHDWHKFLPSEWIPYAEFFYGDEAGAEWTAAAFARAWLAHLHRADHHHQHWVLRNDDGTVEVLEMSNGARREMLADWIGAGRALGKPDTAAWYTENKHRMSLGPDTRRWIEHELAERP